MIYNFSKSWKIGLQTNFTLNKKLSPVFGGGDGGGLFDCMCSHQQKAAELEPAMVPVVC